MLGGRLRQASEDRLVLPVGHGVIVLGFSMSTSSQRTSMRKSRTCTFLHFRVLGADTHCPHPLSKPQVDRFVFPDVSPCDRVGSRPTANSGLMLCSFTVQVPAQLDLLWRFDEDQGPTRSISSSCQKSSTRKWRHGTFLHSVRGSSSLLRNTQNPSVPRLETLSRVSTTAIELRPRREIKTPR